MSRWRLKTLWLRRLTFYGTILVLLNCGAKKTVVTLDEQPASLAAPTSTPVFTSAPDILPPAFSSDLSVGEIGSTSFKIN